MYDIVFKVFRKQELFTFVQNADECPLQMANAFAFASFLGIHVGFIYGGIYDSDKSKVTYITPAPWVFLIW